MIIKTTLIDTGTTSYLSISKKDFLKVCDPHDITEHSGHDLKKVYLEEDQDATTFLKKAEEKGFEIQVKTSYKREFIKKKNYDPNLFGYHPEIDDIINKKYKIKEIQKNIVILVNGLGKVFKLSLKNPFQVIKEYQR